MTRMSVGKFVLAAGVFALAGTGCRQRAATPPAPTMMMPTAMMPTAPPTMGGMPGALAYTVMPGIPTWSASYAGTKMQDNNPSTYWCTPASPTFPVVGQLMFPAPATVQSVSFNTMLPNYATSGAREVTLEALGPTGMVVGMAAGTLAMNSITPVMFPAPVSASMLRLTIRSNYGGSYVGISEMQVMGMGVPAPATVPTPTIAINPFAGGNPIAQINGALAQANQAMASAVGSANGAMASAAQAAGGTIIAWSAGAQQYRAQAGQIVRVICPPGGPAGSIWGTGIYTDDSSICSAAVHAGRIQMATGGPVGVQILPGMPAYTGSMANGITSQSYPQYSGSFSIVP